LVHIDSSLCLFYYLNSLWDFVKAWDLEQFLAAATFYSSVGGVSVEQPDIATGWALGDNLHR